MPTIRKKATKAGIPFYEIAVSRGRNKSRLTTRWYPPEGWSQRAIDRELSKVAAEFERRCHAGEVISRAEQHERDQEAAREAAKVQTVQQYGDLVFMPSKSVTMSENSRSSFQGNLNRWIYPAIGAQKMPDVTAADISALLLSIQAQGKAEAILAVLRDELLPRLLTPCGKEAGCHVYYYGAGCIPSQCGRMERLLAARRGG